MSTRSRPDDVAASILDAWDHANPIHRERLPLPDTLPAAEALQARVVALRRARGERPLGFKIGFTNRSIWPIYGVSHPIWAPVWDSTVVRLDGCEATVRADRFVEPRLEPEIVFGMARSPASHEPAEVFDCIDWIAHGVEIVQSPFPGWKFSAAEAIAAQSLHGALLIGPTKPRSGFPDMQALASMSLALDLDGREVARGTADQVLGSPVLALAHLVRELGARGALLPADAIITTGTITDAQPLAPGQCWQTRPEGIDLPGLRIEVR